MSYWQKTKLVGPLLLFNILLPTWDVFSDVKLSVNLMIGGNQNCSIEEENVQEFRQELDLCLQNPQEYCQSDSVASYLCRLTNQVASTNLSCLKCTYSNGDDCTNSNEGIREIYALCFDLFITSSFDYCSNPNTYHGICKEVTRRHYIFAIMLLGNYEEFYYFFIILIFKDLV